MPDLAIVFHSGYGHTARLAEAVRQGVATASGASPHVIPISADGSVTPEQWDALAAARAIVFGTPTYMGGPSWQFKKFAEGSSGIWAAQGWKDKLAAGFTNSGSMNGDKASTLSWLVTLAMQHGMIWAGTGLLPANKKASVRDDVNYLGAFTGLMAQSPADASATEAPPGGDLATANVFGQRIAQLVATWPRA